jgi:outer membrane protein assembly factor BamB
MYSKFSNIISKGKNVWEFSELGDKIAFFSLNRKMVVLNRLDLTFQEKIESVNKFFLVNPNLAVYDTDTNFTCYTLSNYILSQKNTIEKKILKGVEIDVGQRFDLNLWIVKKEVSIFENQLGIFNIQTGKIFLASSFYPNIVYDGKYVIGGTQSLICSYSKIDGSVFWQVDISNLGKYIPFSQEEERKGEVKKFVGVYKNQLIVLLTGGKFISLDIENGNLNWETNEVNENLTNQGIDYGFSDPYNPFLDEEKGIVYMLQGEVLISLNLNTQKSLYEWHIKDETNEEYIFIRQSRMYKNQIYFTSWKKGNEGNDDTIGIFDIETKKIIWKYTFDFEKGNFIPNSQDNIQVNDSQLFVLDWKGTLHIFERES